MYPGLTFRDHSLWPSPVSPDCGGASSRQGRPQGHREQLGGAWGRLVSAAPATRSVQPDREGSDVRTVTSWGYKGYADREPGAPLPGNPGRLPGEGMASLRAEGEGGRPGTVPPPNAQHEARPLRHSRPPSRRPRSCPPFSAGLGGGSWGETEAPRARASLEGWRGSCAVHVVCRCPPPLPSLDHGVSRSLRLPWGHLHKGREPGAPGGPRCPRRSTIPSWPGLGPHLPPAHPLASPGAGIWPLAGSSWTRPAPLGLPSIRRQLCPLRRARRCRGHGGGCTRAGTTELALSVKADLVSGSHKPE